MNGLGMVVSSWEAYQMKNITNLLKNVIKGNKLIGVSKTRRANILLHKSALKANH